MLGNVGLRFLNDLMIAYFAGVAVIAYGINMIIEGCKIMKRSKGMGILDIICGVIAILVGIFAFLHPILTMLSVGYIICLNVLIQGVNMVRPGMHVQGTCSGVSLYKAIKIFNLPFAMRLAERRSVIGRQCHFVTLSPFLPNKHRFSDIVKND